MTNQTPQEGQQQINAVPRANSRNLRWPPRSPVKKLRRTWDGTN